VQGQDGLTAEAAEVAENPAALGSAHKCPGFLVKGFGNHLRDLCGLCRSQNAVHFSRRSSTSDMMNPNAGQPPDFTERSKYVFARAVSPRTRYQSPSPYASVAA